MTSPKGNIEGRRETKLTVFRSASHWLFVIPPNSKIEQIIYMNEKKNMIPWRGLAHKFAAVSSYTTWTVRVESSSCCFPRELVSFVRPRVLVSFDPWQVTRSSPIEKRIWFGGGGGGGITMLFVGYFKHRYRESSAIKTFTVNRNQKKFYMEDVLPNEIF